MSNKLAIIGGSQAYKLLSDGKFAGDQIDLTKTPFGDTQPIFEVENDGHSFYFLSRHGISHYSIAAPWVNYRANIWALKELGITHIISWSGPGAIDTSLKIGQFVIPHDIIDETKHRKSSFFDNKGWGFIRQNPVFCQILSDLIFRTINQLGLECRQKGIYVCTEGPRLETPAEIRKFSIFGGDMVGMTLVPEVFLAKELEMCYAPMCYITNYAEGIRQRDFRPGVLFEGLLDDDEISSVQQTVNHFPEIILKIAKNIQSIDNSCRCDKSMERYKKQGSITNDWHTWINNDLA